MSGFLVGAGAGDRGRANRREVLVVAPVLDRPHQGRVCALVETIDYSDRAHNVFEVGQRGEVMLVPAARLNGQARARRYPRHQLTSRGVAWDSAYDEWHAARARLAGVPGIGLRRGSEGGEVVYRLAGSEVIDRNKRAFAVSSIAEAALGYYRRGLITRVECERLVRGEKGGAA